MKPLQNPVTFQVHESYVIDRIFPPDSNQLLTDGMDNLVHVCLPQIGRTKEHSWDIKRVLTLHVDILWKAFLFLQYLK